ncbi:hypothetical protein [Ruminococcus flavefaciens]|jgi:hypothetical protein|uniref:hypothetical protein n=1 Tax=Ruminococcus flavefaciens TaxID=1265 RepID=UPI000491B7B5|nr:hypothetical protein [Ruminococcus flavefaciens]
MVTILKERFRSFENERSVVVAELAVDEKTDLPLPGGISGRVLSQGTLAWEITTGDLYGLTSEGTWINQTTGDEYDPSEEE